MNSLTFQLEPKKSLQCLPSSAIRDHQRCFNSDIGIDNFEILDSSKYFTELHILESIYIHKNSPTVNPFTAKDFIFNELLYFLFFITSQNYFNPFGNYHNSLQ